MGSWFMGRSSNVSGDPIPVHERPLYAIVGIAGIGEWSIKNVKIRVMAIDSRITSFLSVWGRPQLHFCIPRFRAGRNKSWRGEESGRVFTRCIMSATYDTHFMMDNLSITYIHTVWRL